MAWGRRCIALSSRAESVLDACATAQHFAGIASIAVTATVPEISLHLLRPCVGLHQTALNFRKRFACTSETADRVRENQDDSQSDRDISSSAVSEDNLESAWAEFPVQSRRRRTEIYLLVWEQAKVQHRLRISADHSVAT
jgi:hypothetical protein